MFFIIFIIIVIYFVLIAWTWQSLSEKEKTKRIIFIIIGIFIMYLITLIIFDVSKKQIEYPNEMIQIQVKRLLVILFTGFNGILFIPYIAKIWNRLEENEIEKNILQKIIIFILLFVICLILELGYLKDIQYGIINIYQSMLK